VGHKIVSAENDKTRFCIGCLESCG